MDKVEPTKNKPTAGQRFGKLVIIQRVHDKKTKTANLKVQVRVECDCGTRLTVPYFYLIRTHVAPKTECGSCGPKSFKALHEYTHRSWYMMNYRCNNPQHIAYASYGGRGIRVCERWHWDTPDAFQNFVADMGDRPSLKYSIDRIENNKGYYPSNCRWATMKEQRANQGRDGEYDPDIMPNA